MGSGSKRKESARPKRIFPSGNTTENTGETGGEATIPDAVGALEQEITLIHLDIGVLRRVREGDPIDVALDVSPIQIVTRYGRLGDIPERWENIVRSNNLVGGIVSQVSLEPPRARVRLRR